MSAKNTGPVKKESTRPNPIPEIISSSMYFFCCRIVNMQFSHPNP